jgi:hypothetical protein
MEARLTFVAVYVTLSSWCSLVLLSDQRHRAWRPLTNHQSGRLRRRLTQALNVRASDKEKAPQRRFSLSAMEAEVGIEPAYTALQAAA